MERCNVITIERQFASGGKQIGTLLAEKLGFKFYNEEILQMAAAKLNTPPEYIQHLEEQTTSSFLYTLAMAVNPSEDQQLVDKLYYVESEIINGLAFTGNCIIVGRGASQIITKRKNCLSVFIYANDAVRIKRAVEDYGIFENRVRDVLRKNDKWRSTFFNTRTEKKWDSMDTYDICLNSGILGIDACVEIIAAAVMARTRIK